MSDHLGKEQTMTRLPSPATLTILESSADPVRPVPDTRHLDFLGRMPIPLRRAFKAGLDRTVADHRAATGVNLDCSFLSGAEWYKPFDALATANEEHLPGMLVTTFHHDILAPGLLARYAPGPSARQPNFHPACTAAGLPDPEGVFRLFAAIPFVFLVDEKRLKGRPAPRAWDDLLDPIWTDDIVFGGWRPNGQVPYQDYNSYLLLSLRREYGDDGLAAFAVNVRHLQHNIRTATQAGSNSRDVGAIAILPWLQAELSPRRERIRVVWPEDGALTMPIGYLVKPEAETRLWQLADYVSGVELGRTLVRNCYPPSNPAIPGAFPAGAKLKWPGWDYARTHDLATESKRAADKFFTAWNEAHEVRECG
ncbi:MAG: ABC transporter substrate-binding protein [Parasulfuritortus sp.]|nr:ABC transporter substrate-binding protein [Parasulfuritortus sp.]